MNINTELKQYIEKTIFPEYQKNDKGHKLDHIEYVIQRSLKFATTIPDINYDMVYTIASYHDIGHSIDAKNHEIVSSEILLNDQNLKKFFSDEEINIMKEAVEDHRASLEYTPRSIYGKIVSSADRNTDITNPIKRTYEYRIAHNQDTNTQTIIDESYNHLKEKFGTKGYATEKMYFEDLDYKKFLEDIVTLLNDKEKFEKLYREINNITK